MKSKFILLCILFFITANQYIFADSPLTSTAFSKAYEKIDIIKKASQTNGVLNNELIDYLSNSKNSIDTKMALINKLGWHIDGKNNSEIFYESLKNKYNYIDIDDFLNNGNSSDLLSMAYLKALDNYFDVDEAIIYANAAKSKNPKSYTSNIITALIEAQKTMDTDWCNVFQLTDAVRNNKSLKKDMKKNGVDIIFEYMDIYKEYCDK